MPATLLAATSLFVANQNRDSISRKYIFFFGPRKLTGHVSVSCQKLHLQELFDIFREILVLRFLYCIS